MVPNLLFSKKSMNEWHAILGNPIRSVVVTTAAINHQLLTTSHFTTSYFTQIDTVTTRKGIWLFLGIFIKNNVYSLRPKQILTMKQIAAGLTFMYAKPLFVAQ